MRTVRDYESPPRRPESWTPSRPGDIPTGQPRGDLLGSQGPDQGYIYVLARRFEGSLQLASDEHEGDAIAGCIGVALKRASLFGRAPVLHDLTAAFTVWGYLGDSPPDLIAFRQPLFEDIANPHHYADQRRVVDLVPEDVLRRTPDDLAEAHRRDWRSLLAI
jgi:hypothetical protein